MIWLAVMQVVLVDELDARPKDPDDDPEPGELEDFLADILMPSGFGVPSPRAPRRRRRR